jgi:hypothetical protein
MKTRRKRSERVKKPDWQPPRPELQPRREPPPVIGRAIVHTSSVEFLAAYTAYFDRAREMGHAPMSAGQWRGVMMLGEVCE